VSIEETIVQLIDQLKDADASESARIQTRINELESLKKEHDTT
jgi:hypothetical protein